RLAKIASRHHRIERAIGCVIDQQRSRTAFDGPQGRGCHHFAVDYEQNVGSERPSNLLNMAIEQFAAPPRMVAEEFSTSATQQRKLDGKEVGFVDKPGIPPASCCELFQGVGKVRIERLIAAALD